MAIIRKEMKDGVEIEVWYDGEEISKEDAKQQGLKRYFQRDAICLRHHISERLVSSGACVACMKVRNKKRIAHISKRKIKKVVEPIRKEISIEEVPDFQLEETGAALVGSAIIAHIKHLESVKNYEAYTKKIKELRNSLNAYIDKYNNAVEQNRNMSEKYNKLQRDFFDQKAELANTINRLNDVKDLVRRRNSSTFSMAEVMKIKEVVGNFKIPTT